MTAAIFAYDEITSCAMWFVYWVIAWKLTHHITVGKALSFLSCNQCQESGQMDYWVFWLRVSHDCIWIICKWIAVQQLHVWLEYYHRNEFLTIAICCTHHHYISRVIRLSMHVWSPRITSSQPLWNFRIEYFFFYQIRFSVKHHEQVSTNALSYNQACS